VIHVIDDCIFVLMQHAKIVTIRFAQETNAKPLVNEFCAYQTRQSCHHHLRYSEKYEKKNQYFI
jgi:hypothetical protein